MPDDLDSRVRRLVAEVLGLPESDVTDKTSSETVSEWDSLAIMNIYMSVEAEFGVEISPEDAASFTSVPNIVERVRRALPN